MRFHEGDQVMHWSYGLGQIVRMEERDMTGSKILFYAVQVRDLTIWVPADGKLPSRLRYPTSMSEFKRLFAILTSPGESLPDDRHERRIRLKQLLSDGRAESLCRIIRDLNAYRKVRPLNDNDQIVLKQSRNSTSSIPGLKAIPKFPPRRAESCLSALDAAASSDVNGRRRGYSTRPRFQTRMRFREERPR